MAKRKVTVRTPTDRDKDDLDRLMRAAGGRAGLIGWMDKYPPSPRKVGRPQKDFFKDFSVSAGPEEGLYSVRFKMGNAATPSYFVIVRPQARRVKKGESKFKTPHQTFAEIAETVWKAHEEASKDQTLSPALRAALDPLRLGLNKEAIKLWLIREVRKIIRSTD